MAYQQLTMASYPKRTKDLIKVDLLLQRYVESDKLTQDEKIEALKAALASLEAELCVYNCKVFSGYVIYHITEEWTMDLDGHYFVFMKTQSVVQSGMCDMDVRAYQSASIVPVIDIAQCNSVKDIVSLGVPRRIIDLYRADQPTYDKGTFWEWLSCSDYINHEDPEPDYDDTNDRCIHHPPFDVLWARIRAEFED